jgi:hypothetical protein
MDSTPPSKDNIFSNWIKKEELTICSLQKTHIIDRNKHWLRVNDWKIYQDKDPWKQAGVAILTLDKVDFKFSLVKKDKEGHFILIKGTIHQKEISIMNLYAPNVSAPTFIRHTLKDLKAHIEPNTVIVVHFYTLLSPIDRSCRQTQQGNPRNKWHHWPNGPKWCLQNISSTNSTIYTLLSKYFCKIAIS